MMKEAKRRVRKKTVVITFRLPETLLKSIDELAEKLGYTSRSDLIRDALRVFVRAKAREVIEEIQGVSQTGKKKRKMVEEVDDFE